MTLVTMVFNTSYVHAKYSNVSLSYNEMRGAPLFERLVIERLLYCIFNLLFHFIVEFKSWQYSLTYGYCQICVSGIQKPFCIKLWRFILCWGHDASQRSRRIQRIQIHRDALTLERTFWSFNSLARQLIYHPNNWISYHQH